MPHRARLGEGTGERGRERETVRESKERRPLLRRKGERERERERGRTRR